jgi:peptidoglycan/LPS O-acetylase OafA/YrhL
MASGSHGRLRSLDALRGVAIGLVVLSHNLPSTRIVPTFPWLCAEAGVVLFFFLSGYLIDRNLSFDSDLVSYGTRRVARILPMYWLSICLAVAFDSHWTWRHVLLNATFLAPLAKTERMAGVYWTLYIEVVFYCMAPFLKGLGDRVLKTVPFVFLASYAVLWLKVGSVPGHAPYHLIYCVMGMQFGLWQRGGLSNGWIWILLVLLGVCAGVFSPISPLIGVSVMAVGILAWIVLRYGFDSRTLAWIGVVSYSWYLLHVIVGFPVRDALSALGAPAWVSGVAGPTVTLAGSALTYALLERPAIELGKRLLAVRAAGQRMAA